MLDERRVLCGLLMRCRKFPLVGVYQAAHVNGRVHSSYQNADINTHLELLPSPQLGHTSS